MKKSEKFWNIIYTITLIILNIISIFYLDYNSYSINIFKALYFVITLTTTIVLDLYLIVKIIIFCTNQIKKFNNWLDKDEITEGDDKLSIRNKKLRKILRWL